MIKNIAFKFSVYFDGSFVLFSVCLNVVCYFID